VLHDTPVVALSKSLPYRGAFGAPRPPDLRRLALPPRAMPAHLGMRPLKAWRYVGVFGPELMMCAAAVRLGPARQSFWAVWDRSARRLYGRSAAGAAGVALLPGAVRISDGRLELTLALDETAGIETVCPSGDAYAWTRKQGGIRAHGTMVVSGAKRQPIEARAIIDDTAAYYERHTHWRWSAGVGLATDGRTLAWNLVDGVNDPPANSERTVWVDGRPAEPGPVRIAPDLTGVGDLRFHAEATRAHRQNLLVVRSRYRQPFGTFSGRLPGGAELESGWGVMEEHDAWW
jgi:hypothetical protein